MIACTFGDATIPMTRPRLPVSEAVLPYLRQIDQVAWHSSHGPLSRSLQERLADGWGVAPQEVALLSGGAAALTLSLIAGGARRGRLCLMPSWTSAASAEAVVRAGLVPFFVDVRADTWVPDPAAVQALALQHDVGAVLIASPFGAPLDMPAWDAVQKAAGVPVVIDGAAAFDALRKGGPMRPGACAVAVSLQATEAFGIGKGGALICRDPAMMDRVRRLAHFGLPGPRRAQQPGLEPRLSEHGAAVGLAALDGWAEARTRWRVAASRYRRLLPACVQMPPGFGTGWVASTLNVLWPANQVETVGLLARWGVDTRHRWGPGCHTQTAYRACPAEALPRTAALARRVVGLPFWQDLSEEEVRQVCAAVARCCSTPALAAA